jgi:hypothetical protein
MILIKNGYLQYKNKRWEWNSEQPSLSSNSISKRQWNLFVQRGKYGNCQINVAHSER